MANLLLLLEPFICIQPLRNVSGMQPPHSSRLVGFDLARTVALFFMLIVNFRVIIGGYGFGPPKLVWILEHLSGRAAVLFMVLAGVGISLMHAKTGGAANPHALRRRLVQRSLFLFPAGYLLFNWWGSDILHFYGMLLIFGAFLAVAPDRRLWTLIALMLPASVAALFLTQPEVFQGWVFPVLSGPVQPGALLDDLLVTGVYPLITWGAFLLFGIWLGRRDLSRPNVWQGLFIKAAAAFMLSGAAAMACERLFLAASLADEQEVFFYWFEMDAFPNTPFFMVSATAGALMVILLCTRAANRFSRSRWPRILARPGRMTLTFYVLHLAFGLSLLDSPGREPSALSPYMALGFAAGFFLFALAFANLWLRRHAHGPLEGCMRAVGDFRLPERMPRPTPGGGAAGAPMGAA